ncbi:DMT family transporter [Beggiatoa alba]|nr:DMT family transporter [Beggiatoa alba]
MSVPAAYLGIVLIWSTTPLAIKWSGESAGFLFGVSARMFISVLVCAVIMSFMSRRLAWHRKAVKAYLVSSIGIFGAMMSVYWGAQFVGSGLISVIFGLTPIVTGLLAVVWLKEEAFTLSKAMGLILGISGIIIIFSRGHSFGDLSIFGVSAIIVAMFLHSGSTVWMKQVQGEIKSLDVVYGGLLVSLPMYAISWLLLDQHWPDTISERTLISITYLGFMGSVVGFILFYYVLQNISASRIGLIPLLTPVLALILGSHFNNEEIPIIVWLGSGLILLGMSVYQWGHRIIRVNPVSVDGAIKTEYD